MAKGHENKPRGKNERLLQARTSRNWTQQELADKIGSTPLQINRWEQGKTRPNPYFRQKLTEAFDMTEEELGIATRTKIQTPALTVSLATPIYDSAIPLTPVHPLVGRENDLARIKEQLHDPESSVVITALNGIPGVGKTSLATAIVHDREIRETFSDGILWAALGPNPNLPGLLSRWAGLLGLSETQFADLSEGQKRQALRTAIGKRSMLLVLDDVWKVEDALTVHVGSHNCSYLITTRFPGIATQMAVGNAMLISELDPERSFQLLRSLAPVVADLEEEKTRALAKAVGGLPLALTLLGNYMRRHSYGTSRRVVKALEQLNNVEMRLQISEPHVQAEAHPSIASSTPISLQSIIAVSDNFLTPLARETLYALSIFPPKPESFSEEAALAVAACTTSELDELLDTGLIEVQGKDRYRLHQIIADYARLQIDVQTEQIVTLRLLAYIQAYVEQHAKEYELLEREITLILYALERTVASAAFDVWLVPLICAAAPFLLMRGYYQEAERFLDRAYEGALASHNIQGQADLLLFLGEIAQKRGELLQAKNLYKQGKMLAESINAMSLVISFSHEIGRMSWKMGDYQEAETLLQEGLTFARTAEQTELICDLCRTLAALYNTLIDHKSAEQYAREGLAIARSLGDRERIIALLINLALGLQLNSPERVALLQEARLLAREIKSEDKRCLVLTNLAILYTERERPDYKQAEAYAQEAIIVARRIGHRERTVWALWAVTVVLRQTGRLEEAEASIQEAFALAKEIEENPRCMCISLDEVGNLALARGNAESALRTFQEEYDLGIRQRDAEIQAVSLFGLGRAYEQLEQWDQALSFGRQSLELLQQKELEQYIERVQVWYEALIKAHKGQQ